jgi:hypothetical protein
VWYLRCLAKSYEEGERRGVSVRFKILRIDTVEGSLASLDGRRRGCTCPVSENPAGAGWDISDDRAIKGFWIDDDCPMHRHLMM